MAAGAAEGNDSGARPSKPAGLVLVPVEEVFDPPFSEHDTEADDEHEGSGVRRYRPWAGAVNGRNYAELYGRGFTPDSEHPQPEFHFQWEIRDGRGEWYSQWGTRPVAFDETLLMSIRVPHVNSQATYLNPTPEVIQDAPSPDHHQGNASDSSVGWGTTPVLENRAQRQERALEAARLRAEA